MNTFIKNSFKFLLLLTAVIVIGIFLPPTPKASKSLLFSKVAKDQLLINTPSPRIIFVGGSNLSFSLNSQMIQNTLQLPVLNLGIKESIGLRYDLASIKRYIRKNDIIIIIPEYTQFYIKSSDCSKELSSTILDLNKADITLLDREQIPNFIKAIPSYAFSKFNIFDYLFYTESEIYSVHSFNQFGDANAHWGLEQRPFPPIEIKDASEYNHDILQAILNFEKDITEKGAQLFLSYPAIQALSFNNSSERIQKVKEEFQKANFKIIGSPDRYVFGNELMFNSPYHLTKMGVDLRTSLLITDIKNSVSLSGDSTFK
ncbi:hypothetical protein [Flammeovirga aprica]|uniref:Uncharacterized protein n=1 Tax=Flammeovirga aprica JL-4 TaxID=694437 RepID=A0A7X9XBU0_9BACT|nr:hypothetical protein [Flammeovirga aprica]NME71096.1 hypothetical protein [Flammeovirga aprica JL-4]